ncbi:ParA family protein [Propionicicella superfundia]|uniref:ParA family protein n=1 Tax=Propionicicella superfundia TaxID=348582 RepID=UPI0004280B4B|nr:ParA family protein [Propionicicella superfundia]
MDDLIARRAAFDTAEFPEEGLEVDDLAHEPDVSRETSMRIPPSPRIIVVANQKGGVGKTTSVVNIAAAMALEGLRVLVIDLDPQGNASTALNVEHREGVAGTYEVLIDGDDIIAHVQRSPESDNLWVLPATLDLAGADIALVNMHGRETRLQRALQQFLIDAYADYIFIDCPPSLGLLTLNALVAAREIMIPIQCEYYALEGVTQLLRTINIIKGNLNDRLELTSVLLTMYDARTRQAQQVADEVRAHFPQTLSAAIPRSVRVSEAPSYGQSVITYHRASAGAQAYLQAATEIAAQA